MNYFGMRRVEATLSVGQMTNPPLYDSRMVSPTDSNKIKIIWGRMVIRLGEMTDSFVLR